MKTSTADLLTQFELSHAMYEDLLKATAALHEITVLRGQLKTRNGQAPVAAADQSLQARLDMIAGPEHSEGGSRGGAGRGAPGGAVNLTTARTQLARLEHEIQQADEAPTTAQTIAAKASMQPVDSLVQQWGEVKANDVKALNQELLKLNLSALKLTTSRIDHDVEDQVGMGDVD